VKVLWVVALLLGLTGGYQSVGGMFALIFNVEVWRVLLEINGVDPQEEGRFP
jgi:hypothetical protein